MSPSFTVFRANTTAQRASSTDAKPILTVVGTKRQAPYEDMPSDRAAKKRQRNDSHDDEGKKQRGRPRVDGQDETAADRRRTQIRLAQRAYRQRKESTIANLKEQVTTLRSTIEEMENIFLAYNDRAVASGMLQKAPELAKDLKAATEAFIQLAKKTHATDDAEDRSETEVETIPMKPRATYENDISMFMQHDAGLSNSIGSSPDSVDHIGASHIGLGYTIDFSSEGSSSSNQLASPAPTSAQSALTMHMGMDFSDYSFSGAGPNTNPLAVAPTTSSRPEIPRPIIALSAGDAADMLKVKSISAPYTYSFKETTFARRLQRASLERGFQLITNAETRPSSFLRVFRLSLLYHTRETLLAKFRRALSRSTDEPLETFQTPFIHLGGAGMHYNTGRVRNGYIVKPGPMQRQAILESTESPGAVVDIDLDLSEYEGEWFDSNDVEGYLNELGLFIDPQSSFAEGNITLPDSAKQLLANSPATNVFDSPNASNVDAEVTSLGSGTIATPQSPMMSNVELELGMQRLFPELGAASPNTLSNSQAIDWLMGSGDKTPDFLSSGWMSWRQPAEWDAADAVGYDNSGLSNVTMQFQRAANEKRQVTVDVSRLIDELIMSAICLGRAPGFRKRDVDRALTSAIIQIF
ncbi:uncharacterized protein PV09_00512 [Verruconis gallopava]|uniref:BZIP domain-containing protein n=1 Tax=Verruconis gallopava TaxID=253628 RepID=A0A0D2BB99_9PEZI|nr:uncharacterized protein PV09_00512 [Verruconis gallopava]KIW08544.1 hypothetical protein PV09_00512 [Verruconis gallopava]